MYYYLQMCISMEGLNDYDVEAYDSSNWIPPGHSYLGEGVRW